MLASSQEIKKAARKIGLNGVEFSVAKSFYFSSKMQFLFQVLNATFLLKNINYRAPRESKKYSFFYCIYLHFIILFQSILFSECSTPVTVVGGHHAAA